MKNYYVVIGANFGDEGKGRIVDWLTNTVPIDVVVRYSGGGQCSHTVVTEDGKRHIFKHYSSGTFRNIKTYLNKDVVINPRILLKEKEELYKKFNLNVPLEMSSMCEITTPFDVLKNREDEKIRSEFRIQHGSCGIGFGQTKMRRDNGHSLRISDVLNLSYTKLYKKIYDIKKYYEQNGSNSIIRDFNNIDIHAIIKELIEIVETFNIVQNEYKYFDAIDNVVFESSQGLLLNEDNEDYFPHVTYAKVGMENLKQYINDHINDKIKVNIFYITRPYITRHGAGPFFTENDNMKKILSKENTNVTNEFQGKFRCGNLDLDYLYDNINQDCSDIINKNYFTSDVTIKKNVVVTCLDHIENSIDIIRDRKYTTANKKYIPHIIFDKFNKHDKYDVYFCQDIHTIKKHEK